MQSSTYDYQGVIAEYWDLLRGDTSQWTSRPYFLKVIRDHGEPALDVACGTGRLLLEYLPVGVDIDGVDIAADMLDQCRAKAQRAGLNPTLYMQAMQSLDLPRRYRSIIVPSSSFQYLTDLEDAHHALKQFFAHLQPGGVLAMSLRVFEPALGDEEWDIDSEAIRPSDGAVVRRWFRCSYDVPNRLQNTEDRYEIIRDGEVVTSQTFVSSPALTWYAPSEVTMMLTTAGFVDVRACVDFSDTPATDADTNFVVLGKKPS